MRIVTNILFVIEMAAAVIGMVIQFNLWQVCFFVSTLLSMLHFNRCRELQEEISEIEDAIEWLP